jgi:hypothetical protein
MKETVAGITEGVGTGKETKDDEQEAQARALTCAEGTLQVRWKALATNQDQTEDEMLKVGVSVMAILVLCISFVWKKRG